MMDSIVGPGIVLRRSRHLDHDVKLTILFRDFGRLGAVSKGGLRMNSKLKSVQEIFTEADFQMFAPPHGTHGRLSGGRLINSHRALRQNVEAFGTASRCLEVVDTLLPYRAPAPDVYDILRRSLQAFQASGASQPPQHEWVLFIVRLLKVLGHGDVSDEAAKLLSGSPIERCVAYVEAELERILPWRLKSTVEVH